MRVWRSGFSRSVDEKRLNDCAERIFLQLKGQQTVSAVRGKNDSKSKQDVANTSKSKGNFGLKRETFFTSSTTRPP